MTSSGSVTVLLALQTLFGAGPDSLGSPPPHVPRALARRVAHQFADAWGRSPATVRLAWGRATTRVPLADDVEFRVLGRGTGGWFAVVFEPEGSRACAMQVRAGIVEATAVAARALPRGAVLAPGDLREERVVRWGAPTASATRATEPARSGWRTRRAVASGEALAWPAATPPPMVQAGQPLKLEWIRDGVRVELDGIALHDAREGETVRARVPERPARLIARVVAPGVAELPSGAARAGEVR